MPTRIPRRVVHYSRFDPETTQGGVESFARNLRLSFEHVEFMTPKTRDEARVRRERLPVICDNHMVLDWSPEVPLIGFRHGMAWRKAQVTRSLHDLSLAAHQVRAARRRNVTWVSCAQWIDRAFAPLAGGPGAGVVYHPVDLERFDGRLENEGSRLVLHDARSEHKGRQLFQHLAQALPKYRFEALACPSSDVPERMRKAAAFMHLSRYEGNSIVCNEAMAMNLPCLFTRVGLMLDPNQHFDVQLIEPDVAFRQPAALTQAARDLLASLPGRSYGPRAWVTEHASLQATGAAWAHCLAEFDKLSWPRHS
jgi:glycosyltransferase involved in cell wall biosynthesis